MIDVNKIRLDFPILNRVVNGKKLVYLDNAATSQKPQVVIDSISDYYQNYNANVHRGLHTLSEEATERYEGVREKVRAFIDAPSEREIVYTRNTTEAINLVAYSWGRNNIHAGDEIVISALEHHANLIPWQLLAKEKNAKLVFIELTSDGQLDMQSAQKAISTKTKLVAISAMSNAIGTILPVKEIVAMAKAVGATVLIDAAQSAAHSQTSVKELGCDFLVFSMHKLLGPTGVGFLWGRAELLESMPPFMTGGDMISSVFRDRTTWNEIPFKFEAGTPNIADVIASGVALDYLTAVGMDNVRAHEKQLVEKAIQGLEGLGDATIYGPKDATNRGGLVSFNLADVHPHDLGQILNESGVAIRAGHHCCQPLMRDLGVSGTARASFYIYNTLDEVDLFLGALKEADKVLGHVACR